MVYYIQCTTYLCLCAESDGERVNDALEIADIREDESEEDGQERGLADPLEEQVHVGRGTNYFSLRILEKNNNRYYLKKVHFDSWTRDGTFKQKEGTQDC